jgi:hypothetical protein
MMEQLSGNPLLLSHPFAQPAAIRSCGPLLLVVHGRAGGLIPEEIRAFSAPLAAIEAAAPCGGAQALIAWGLGVAPLRRGR